MSTTWKVIAIITAIILVFVASFFITAGILWLICHLLEMSWWSWKVSGAVWLCELLIEGILNGNTIKVKLR